MNSMKVFCFSLILVQDVVKELVLYVKMLVEPSIRGLGGLGKYRNP